MQEKSTSELIRPFSIADIPEILILCESIFGPNYFRNKELEQILKGTTFKGQQYSLGLYLDGKLKGFRLTYPPGLWIANFENSLAPDKWPKAPEHTAYFKTIAVAKDLAGLGWGKKLSSVAIELLRKNGAQGVVAHSWKESPHNSSEKYLLGLGFKPVAEHKEYWKMVDYLCSKCQKKPCLCTATEMYLEL